MRQKMCIYKCMLNVYKNQQNRQTGSRNLTRPKTLPTIWGTYMKLVTKYQISAINSCWEKCDEKWAYMFNVYKNQQSRQTGNRNLMGPKSLPTIWGTYMKLVTKYQISAIDSCWEKCDEKYLGRRKDGQTDRGKTVYPPPPPGSGGITIWLLLLSATINNISAISWWSVLWVDKIIVPCENQQPAASNWQTGWDPIKQFKPITFLCLFQVTDKLVGIPLNSLSLSHSCACSKREPGFPTP
jgi:hypothetical protein